jgi:uncharacterized membrane protein required for colicin V production
MKYDWFDIVVVLVLIWGIVRGRKRGMSMELLPVLEVLIIVVAGAEVYQILGRQLANVTNGSISLLLSYVLAYILFIIIVHVIFAKLRTAVGEKLVGSDMFGSMEYYFGMVAGLIRYAGVLIIVMALMNAQAIDKQHDAAQTRMQIQNFGKKYFPTFTGIQIDVLERSMTGSFMVQHLNHLLITPTKPGGGAPAQEPIARKRERAVDEVMETKPKK